MQATEITVQIHFYWLALATFGGLARYLYMYLRKREVPIWPVMGAHILVSCFAGYMVASMIYMFDPKWVFIGAGIGGYMGTEALDWLARVLQHRFGGEATMVRATRAHDTKVAVQHYFTDDTPE